MSDLHPKVEVDDTKHRIQPTTTVTQNAILKLTSLDQYTGLRNHRLRFEDAFTNMNAERVHQAGKLDIIFGKGKNLQDHPGNQRMRQITKKYKHVYYELQRSQKRNLVENVYKEIVSNVVRFLTKAPSASHYLLVDVEVALQKISSSLRCRKEEKRQRQKERQTSSHQQSSVPGATSAAASPILERPYHSTPSKVDDQQSLSRESGISCNAQQPAVLPMPSLHAMFPRSNAQARLTTLQQLNQYRRLRLMMDARMKSSMAIGRTVMLASSQQTELAAPQKEAPDAK